MRNELAKTRNIRLLSECHKELVALPPRIKERIGLVYGASGLGKSTAIAWLSIQVGGVFVEASPNWTPYSMLCDIAKELGAMPTRATKSTEDVVIERLAMAENPLFIDECDWIADNPRLLETIRKIHDCAGIPVILIGMERLENKLSKREQLSSRIAKKLKFQPADLIDAKALAATCCEVGLVDEVIEAIHVKSRGSIRRIIVELAKAEAFTKSQRLEALPKALWDAYFKGVGK